MKAKNYKRKITKWVFIGFIELKIKTNIINVLIVIKRDSDKVAVEVIINFRFPT